MQATQIALSEYKIDTAGFAAYLERARYDLIPEYYCGGTAYNFTEKALEHYVAAELLALSPDDVYCDVASDASPTPKIYKSLFGCTTYRQDLSYPLGLNGDTIGGDAARMPVPDGFFSKAALHCSFEHFEGDADTRFIREAARILKPGGRMCIAPLYLAETYHILTDLNVLDSVKDFPREDALVFYREKWGNRFGRHYDVAHLARRVLAHTKGLKVTVFHITNAKEINPSCYLTFALIFEKES